MLKKEIGSPINNATNIVLGIDERFIRGASVCIASATHNSTNGICAHIMYGRKEIPHHVITHLEYLVENTDKLCIKLYTIDDFASDFLVTESITSAMYYRYGIGELLYGVVNRAIYLDADIVVDCNLDELYQIDMQGKWLGAVEDYVPDTSIPNDIRMKEFYDGLYFNSGVLLIDVNAWKEHRVFAQAIEKTKEVGHKLKHYDQDVLNIIFANQWVELDHKWNCVSFKQELTPHVVAHYLGSFKPWTAWYIDESVGLYDKYEALTLFSGTQKQLPHRYNVKDAKYFKRFLWRKKDYINALKWEAIYMMWKLFKH